MPLIAALVRRLRHHGDAWRVARILDPDPDRSPHTQRKHQGLARKSGIEFRVEHGFLMPRAVTFLHAHPCRIGVRDHQQRRIDARLSFDFPSSVAQRPADSEFGTLFLPGIDLRLSGIARIVDWRDADNAGVPGHRRKGRQD
ncbi:hypothetical protein [Pseudoxanthomonas kalamensis]|uniref:hypothetical protein n=1 Tax=Pseudoxanthomonas kalamensis TaxID=289483 RepID=UPI001391B713|nr:hypothetical protein [Pseudoxanthomonas kalamensis]